MRRVRRAWPILAAVLLSGCMELSPQPAPAPQGEDGLVRVEGTVLQAPDDRPSAGADLRLFRPDSKYYPMTTGHDGRFGVDIPAFPGCTIEVKKAGFQTTRFEIDCATDANVVLRIEVATGPASSTATQSARPAPSSSPRPSAPASPAPEPAEEQVAPAPVFYGGPQVIVAVPDTGINPYHRLYYRPHYVYPPCTYLPDFPCDLVKELPLSVGEADWNVAFEKDKDLWASVKQGEWYWIPRTVFVAVHCAAPYTGSATSPAAAGTQCILDDSHMHGTGTTSSVIMENPDALIAFSESSSAIDQFRAAKIPVDIFSVSWGNVVPFPVPSRHGLPAGVACPNGRDAPLYVVSAGNDPRSTLTDCWKGNPRVIAVGGAYAQGRTEEPQSSKHADVVSYFCRPTAQTRSVDAMRPSYCGTSFSSPTVAGALSKVVLEVRRASGYTGSITKDGYVDPVLKVTVQDLRDALNRTASYTPRPRYPNSCSTCPAVNPERPWLQWNWGFYDADVANATIAHLLRSAPAPDKSADAKQYMAAVWTGRTALYG